ncbi:hypothetical protein V8E36_002161 [Tilletia maclaganii]
MAKGGGKSSASSATRKKQAAKAAKKSGQEQPPAQQPKQRGQKKDKKAPKKKVFIPPPKPPQPAPDPLDALGVAALLPPDLVVHLRKASKKDVLTRQRALEGLQAWIRGTTTAGDTGDDASAAGATLDEEERISALVTMLPSWVHIFPRLSISPTRRLRILTAQILADLLAIPDVRAELLFSPQYAEALLGPWAILAWDTDRQTARIAREAWDHSVCWRTAQSQEQDERAKLIIYDHLPALVSHLYILLLTLSPSTVLAHNAPHAANTPAATSMQAQAPLGPDASLRDAKNRDETVEEDVSATDRRLAAGALGNLAWIISTYPRDKRPVQEGESGPSATSLFAEDEQLERLITSPSLWSSLAPIQFEIGGRESLPFLGLGSPPTRQRAWDLLKALTSSELESLRAPSSSLLAVIAPIALMSAWGERDHLVLKNMLVALLPLLRAVPETWRVADAALGGDEEEEDGDDSDEDDDNEGEDEEEGREAARTRATASSAGPSSITSPSFLAFEHWIETGCGGAPELCLPTVVLFLATVPAATLPVDIPASEKVLSALARSTQGPSPAIDTRPAMSALISGFCDCVIHLAHRLARSSDDGDAGPERSDAISSLVAGQLGWLWSDLVLGASAKSAENTSQGQQAESSERQRRPRGAELVSERALIPLVSCIEQLAGFGAPGANATIVFFRRVSQETLSLAADSEALEPAQIETVLGRALAPLEKLGQSGKLPAEAKAEIDGLVLGLAETALGGINAEDDAEQAQSKVAVGVLSTLLRRFPATFASSREDVLTRIIQAGSDSIPTLFRRSTISARETIAVLAALSAVSPRAAAAMQGSWPRMVQIVSQLPDAGMQAGAIIEMLPAIQKLDARGSGNGAGEEALLTPALRMALSDIAVELTSRLCEGDDDGSSAHQADLAKAIGGIVSLSPAHIDLEPLGEALALLTSLIEHVGLDALRISSTAAPLPAQHSHQVTDEDEEVSSPVSPPPPTAMTNRQLPFALDVLALWLRGGSSAQTKDMMHAGEAWSVVPVVFALAQVSPESPAIAPEARTAARRAWEALRSDAEAVSSVDAFVDKQVEDNVLGVSTLLELAKAAASIPAPSSSSSAAIDRLLQLLPSEERMAALALDASKVSSSLPILAVVDPLVPLSNAGTSGAEPTSATKHDFQGLSAYARGVLIHLNLSEEDRAYRSQGAWLLPHFVLLGIMCEDRLLHASAWTTSLSAQCGTEIVRDILDRSVKISTAILSSLASTLDSDWHTSITADLQSGGSKAADGSGLAGVLRQAWALAKGSGSTARYRVLSRLVSGVLAFSAAESKDVERWLRLAQQAQSADAELTQAVVLPAKALALGTPLYERLCNEAAARLAGVPASKANTEGIALLRVANALAPPPTSENAFIPQQRAIFLLQALQKWVASDEDLDDEINAHLARLFVQLAPIVQGMSGSHLDFFFDVIEANLDVAVETVDEDDGIPAAYHTLKLLETIMDLASSNATLREVFAERQDGITELLSKLFAGLAPSATSSARLHSIPREICNNLLVDLIHRIPESKRAGLVSNPDILAALLDHRAQQVQVISYRLLSAYIYKQVQEAVVEAAMDQGAAATATPLAILPALLPKAGTSVHALVDHIDDVTARNEIFGFLLNWLAILDHFEEGSLQLKSVYLAQLQKTDLAGKSLFPVLFALFAASQHVKPYDASKFAIDEIFLDDLELSSLSSLQALAGHVFYRALIHLPSLIRNWWFSIKDRQLSLHVASFTTRHCSPLLAAKELAHLRRPDALEQLQDEALSVRILSGSNEVIATYTIDEHAMEIGIRLPQDYPLHGAEIRDIKRVGGVSEGQWRAWLLAVQQLISSRNGLVFDALMLFKKNAEAKFSGFEGRECAICYSIISPIDESLPTKPCKTCKNAFHSSCLLKWVVQSGSSTCPLCRSII